MLKTRKKWWLTAFFVAGFWLAFIRLLGFALEYWPEFRGVSVNQPATNEKADPAFAPVTGLWHLDANHYLLTVIIEPDPANPQLLRGSLIDQNNQSQTLDQISWDGFTKTLEFRRSGSNFWQWYRATLNGNTLSGYFSHSTQSALKPPQFEAYRWFFTGTLYNHG